MPYRRAVGETVEGGIDLLQRDALAHLGVDGQAAGAFEKRSPVRDARFSVAGEGPASGDWRISGVREAGSVIDPMPVPPWSRSEEGIMTCYVQVLRSQGVSSR